MKIEFITVVQDEDVDRLLLRTDLSTLIQVFARGK